ncbi:hypothetical protein [Devosia sp. SL43]|uniref:hypothetical protein n=1 Tax=Devosia sp. SL43 TaxID=2806348 RepID=UPI001F3BEBCF|nr:hypothetical protein [Devosia sp. SL43]UJW83918.1 hypothetical protein IM737_10565 [Devosia sp. SL43]
MTESELQSDCSQCVGLCCVALSFDRSDRFGHDKVAGEPCYHLDAAFRCSIHARREALGYDGCEAFECLGAGQRATAVFATRNWRRDPAVARQLYGRFALLTKLQEMRQALMTAVDLELPGNLDGERLSLLERIIVLADGHDENIDSAAAAVLAQAKDFLRRLADVVSV